MSRGAKPGGICRYEYDVWVADDGRLYVKVTGLQYERATFENFDLAARRRMRTELERLGLPRDWANGMGNVEVWDLARDWASQLPEAYTFRTTNPLPDEVLTDAAAA